MRFGGIVVAALLLIGACSSDPTPKEPDPTRSAAPTPTATPPPMPDQAKEDSPEGAAAFVQHYVDVFNYAAATGDVRELSALSSPDCEGCQSYIELYRKTYEAGGYFKGGEWKIGKLEMEQSRKSRRIFAHLDAPAGRQLERAGGQVGPTTPEDAELIFVVGRATCVVETLSRTS